MTYKLFRTGLTYTDVAALLREERRQKRENGLVMFISRSTVLGRWHQLKLEMWEYSQGVQPLDD